MPIKNGDRVKVHYTGTLSDGTEFDSSRNREPLECIIGEGSLIPGFENALKGHKAGDRIKVVIPPEDAYGPADPELVFKVAKSQVPENIPLKAGTPLQLSNEQGQMDVVISGVGQDEITLDANHPLAGQELVFDIEVVEVNK